jgi:RNase P/RNase MRP subunit POP5
MAKIKALLPTLRERKRYVVFEIISKNRTRSFAGVSKAIWQGMLALNGQKGAAQAGLLLLPNKYDEKSQRGIARVGHKDVDAFKASLTTIQEIDNSPAIARSIAVSGSLKKASTRLAG